MTKETNLNIVPVALLRMAGYPVQLMDQFRIPGKELSCASFINEAFVIRKKLREFIKKIKIFKRQFGYHLKKYTVI